MERLVVEAKAFSVKVEDGDYVTRISVSVSEAGTGRPVDGLAVGQFSLAPVDASVAFSVLSEVEVVPLAAVAPGCYQLRAKAPVITLREGLGPRSAGRSHVLVAVAAPFGRLGQTLVEIPGD